ncbi:MAG TPA: hypothetical protein PKG93_03765 [Bacilli bacterium]|nr:hypothetical protein [Bacilli bacterium]
MPNIVEYFDYFITKANLSWYNHNPVVVKTFSYHLSQYTPSVYAEILLIINSDYFEDFKNIENFSIKDRIIEVWFENELYSLKHNSKFFSGPFKFCVVNYEVVNFDITEMDIEYSDINSGKLINLKCVDPVFYNMQLSEKFESYGKTSISEIVRKIVSRNGGKINKLVPTDFDYNWLQTQLTDYEMIRSMLPYARSTNGELLYNFFMFNNEAYFAPITQSLKTPYLIKLDMIKNSKELVYITDFKSLIEKYGSRDNLIHFNRGYNNFKGFKPDSMPKQSYIGLRPKKKGFGGLGDLLGGFTDFGNISNLMGGFSGLNLISQELINKSDLLDITPNYTDIIQDYSNLDLENLESLKQNISDLVPNQDAFNPKARISDKKQHKGLASQYITSSIDEEELQEIYISNLRHRVYTFGKLVDTFAEIIPELTPLNCVEIISQENGKAKDLNGIYYIASITYSYGMTNTHPYQPYMHMVLCSELDSKGMENPEGEPIYYVV